MPVTARALAARVVERVLPDSNPCSVEDLMVSCLVEHWSFAEAEALEAAEKLAERTINVVRKMHDGHISNYTFKTFTFNSSDENYLQGVYFVEPHDDEETAASKIRRAQLLEVRSTLMDLSTDDFERLCGAILRSFSPMICRLTAYRSDQGIDFYAKVPWLPPMLSAAVDLQVFSRFQVWIVGQAKRYLDSQVSTPDLRDLVGAVALARSGAYSLVGDRYPELKMRLCDPVYYLFMTTGELSREAVELASRSGVIALDGFGVAELAAHMKLGFDDAGRFEEKLLLNALSLEDGSGEDGATAPPAAAAPAEPAP